MSKCCYVTFGVKLLIKQLEEQGFATQKKYKVKYKFTNSIFRYTFASQSRHYNVFPQ